MDITFKKSESSVRPAELDESSSAVVTYIRKNIEQVEREDFDGNKYTMFEYDEAILTKIQYALYKVSVAAGEDNTDAQMAIAELAGTMEDEITGVQEAIAELAEIITNNE